MGNKAKILLFDVETAPNKAYIWSLWQEVKSTDFITTDWYTLCWCAKWLDGKQIMSGSLPNSPTYKDNPECDKHILNQLHALLDEADIVIAHNAKKFDCRKIRTRFVINNMPPPSPFRVIDTLAVARREFAFTSNRLDSLGQFLGVGRKVKTGGFDLWKKCLNGNLSAWKKMVRYCRGDIRLLESVYRKMLPYISNHPNIGVYSEGERPACTNCGSDDIVYRGYAITNSNRFKRFKCKSCGSWGRERTTTLDKDTRKAFSANITG